jgi:hypothetical protein
VLRSTYCVGLLRIWEAGILSGFVGHFRRFLSTPRKRASLEITVLMGLCAVVLQNAQESDTTDDDSSNAVKTKSLKTSTNVLTFHFTL